MYTVKVRLCKPRRVFSFSCDDIPLNRDDTCIVQSDRGVEMGVCILPPEPCAPEMAKRYTMRVLRKVTQTDESTQRYLAEEEGKARAICLDKIKTLDLPMKLVDVEYTFDKHKIIFYFTAEERVDFRELVRDLAHELRTRIELRHIQVRDEAKMVGGLGSCGRELCCSTWLNEFKPISMRMAKRQRLSLNPTKLSGQCGRLLCCLSYENDQYEDFKKSSKRTPAAPSAKTQEKAADAHPGAETEEADDKPLNKVPKETAVAVSDPGIEREAVPERGAEAVSATIGDGPREAVTDGGDSAPAESAQNKAKEAGQKKRRGRSRKRNRGRRGKSRGADK